MRRLIAAVLAALCVLNGSIMLCAGPSWYARVPGASETGPYNPHFVEDIGAAFLVSGLAFAARAWRAAYWPAAVAGASFLAVHGLIHLVGIVTGHDHHTTFDLAAVVLPAALDLTSSAVRKQVGRNRLVRHLV